MRGGKQTRHHQNSQYSNRIYIIWFNHVRNYVTTHWNASVCHACIAMRCTAFISKWWRDNLSVEPNDENSLKFISVWFIKFSSSISNTHKKANQNIREKKKFNFVVHGILTVSSPVFFSVAFIESLIWYIIRVHNRNTKNAIHFISHFISLKNWKKNIGWKKNIFL